MSRWHAATVAQVLGTDARGSVEFRRISTDTRTLEQGDLFVALAGERFDGHAFLQAAREAGAAGAVVRRGTPPVDGLVLFEVDDTLRALGQLARRRRDDVAGPVVGITGTNGKTSTKELMSRAMGVRWSVHATHGNLNNEVGVPLTLLAAPETADALVVEAGASVPGEIGRLRAIIDPTAAIITNVSAGHVEGFGSVDTILDEKLALLDGVPLAVVGTTPAELFDRAGHLSMRVISAGLQGSAQVRPDRWWLDERGCPTLVFRGVTVRVPLAGRHQGDNAMLALALAEALELDVAAVAAALSSVVLPEGRCQWLHAGGLTVLHDAYNANPASFAAALDMVDRIRGQRPLVVVVGEMLELGAAASEAHAAVARAIVDAAPAIVGAMGAFVPAFDALGEALADRLVVAESAEDLGRLVAARLHGNELVLLKGSRGMRMERALPHLLPNREAECSTTC